MKFLLAPILALAFLAGSFAVTPVADAAFRIEFGYGYDDYYGYRYQKYPSYGSYRDYDYYDSGSYYKYKKIKQKFNTKKYRNRYYDNDSCSYYYCY